LGRVSDAVAALLSPRQFILHCRYCAEWDSTTDMRVLRRADAVIPHGTASEAAVYLRAPDLLALLGHQWLGCGRWGWPRVVGGVHTHACTHGHRRAHTRTHMHARTDTCVCAHADVCACSRSVHRTYCRHRGAERATCSVPYASMRHARQTDQLNGTQGISDSNQSIGLNEMLLISRNFGFVPGTSSPHLRRDSAYPCPHLHRDSAH
jgi:hypothetical protein